MAPEVVDLISSSPLPDLPTARPDCQHPARTQCLAPGVGSRTDGLSRSQVGNINPVTSSYSTIQSSDTGLNFLSRNLALETDRSPKRRRLNPLSAGAQPAPVPPDSSLSANFPESCMKQSHDDGKSKDKRRIPSDDLDPFASSPLPSTTTLTNHNAGPVVDLSSSRPNSSTFRITATIGSDPHDIFLSSPLPKPAAPDSANGKAKQSSPDPFESSPLAPTMKKKARLGTADSSDSFASSPPPRKTDLPKVNPRRVRQQSSRKMREYDPISSSAPELHLAELPTASKLSKTAAASRPVITIDDSDAEGQQSSDHELPALHNIKPVVPRHAARETLRRTLSDTWATDRQTGSRQQARHKAESTSEERTRARESKQRAQEANKEAKRLEREQQKRLRALEKEKAAALAEVNKIRTDKKVSTREMIVDLPAGLNETLKTQVETILEGLNVLHTTWQSPLPNVIKLRRRVDSRFDDDLGYWVPCQQRVMDEDHIIIIVTAVELAKLAQEGLDVYIETVTTQLPSKKQLYILEGVTPWMRKNRNARNRNFASGVRAQTNSNTTATSSQRRRRGNNTPLSEPPISDDVMEDAILQLQVTHGALIHHTNIPLETAQWIGHFTQHLSTAPYRRQRDISTTMAGFCMESGQVRTGDGAADTYVRMLQEVARVTQPVAYGVAAEFGTVTKLVKGLELGGPGTLENARKCANKDGAFSDRTLGKAVSKRLWQVFTGQDESSTDI